MGDKKRQTATLGLLGLAAGAVLIGLGLLESPRIADWYQDRPPSPQDSEKTSCYFAASSYPTIDAVIQAVHGRSAILSVGIVQGVEVGYEFTVYRGDQFVGKVQVMEVNHASSKARILFESDGRMMQPGDIAATQI
jgi:hypothetical protein